MPDKPSEAFVLMEAGTPIWLGARKKRNDSRFEERRIAGWVFSSFAGSWLRHPGPVYPIELRCATNRNERRRFAVQEGSTLRKRSPRGASPGRPFRHTCEILSHPQAVTARDTCRKGARAREVWAPDAARARDNGSTLGAFAGACQKWTLSPGGFPICPKYVHPLIWRQ